MKIYFRDTDDDTDLWAEGSFSVQGGQVLSVEVNLGHPAGWKTLFRFRQAETFDTGRGVAFHGYQQYECPGFGSMYLFRGFEMRMSRTRGMKLCTPKQLEEMVQREENTKAHLNSCGKK